jgi:hypothetical protein
MFRELEIIANLNERQLKAFERVVKLMIRTMGLPPKDANMLAMKYIIELKKKQKK